MKLVMKPMILLNNFNDILDKLSFLIGILNLEENLTQSDKQEIVNKFDQKTQELLHDIHAHLRMQDEKLDKIIKLLENQSS